MNNPFDYEPHPLCQQAVEEVKQYLLSHPELREDADRGKMFGVLVYSEKPLRFLAAYSGLLAGRNDWEWFVPPVYDAQQPNGHFKRTESAISSINLEIAELKKSLSEETQKKADLTLEVEAYRQKVQAAKVLRDERRLHHNLSPEEEAELIRESQFMKAELHRMKKRLAAASPISDKIEELKEKRKTMSEELQRWLFSQYILTNYKGEKKSVLDIFEGGLPPAATGDCCAPKLLNYAFTHNLKPLYIAEFWWGESPKQEVRHHLHYYPACRGRCLPLLSWMLPRESVAIDTTASTDTIVSISIIFEDDQIAVIVKPAGMLSVPGNTGETSVYDIMRQRYPDTDSPLIVHRLDQATSGIMVIAKTLYAYRNLQRQFSEHTVEKRYVAVLENPPQPPFPSKLAYPLPFPKEGEIALPLRPDINDRPRQVVDYEHGKPAVTHWELGSRLFLYPKTGRTHQLRVHCAHKDGLNNPILGDKLYGSVAADRLYLHADRLTFTHPTTNERLTFESPAPF